MGVSLWEGIGCQGATRPSICRSTFFVYDSCQACQHMVKHKYIIYIHGTYMFVENKLSSQCTSQKGVAKMHPQLWGVLTYHIL